MKRKLLVHVERPKELGGELRWQAVFEEKGEPNRTLWFGVPLEHAVALTPRADPFAIWATLWAMGRGRDLEVRGVVSPSLLNRLEEYSRIWHWWKPARYTPVACVAEREEEFAPAGPALCLFSGGLDSIYTALRHKRADMGRQRVALTTGVLVHGAYDLPESSVAALRSNLARSGPLAAELGLKLWTIRNNYRELPTWWGTTHGAALAACMSVYAGGFGTGLIASTYTHDLSVCWGSNAFTDTLCSSGGFTVVHDAGDVARVEKMATVWRMLPGAIANLRVCFENKDRTTNCGLCEKCIYTRLSLLAIGAGDVLPGAKPPLTCRQIAGLTIRRAGVMGHLQETHKVAVANGLGDTPWARTLGEVIRRDLPPPGRKLTRGERWRRFSHRMMARFEDWRRTA